MNSYPDERQVIDDLGAKFLGAFVDAVAGARADLTEFRVLKPEWFVGFSNRFVSNFIHERMWDRMQREVSDDAGVTIIDREPGPTRQIIIGAYVIRFKRHSAKIQISTYETQGAIAFWTNRIAIPGLEAHSLALGYIWDVHAAEIRDTILSYRTDKDHPLWWVTLARSVATSDGPAQIDWEPADPTLPQIDISDAIDEDGEADGTADQP